MSESLGYICGVLDGDGYIDRFGVNPRLSLMTTNQAFSKKFAKALTENKLIVRATERDRHNSWQQGDKKYEYDSHFFIIRATCPKPLMAQIEQVRADIFQRKSKIFIQ